jgi:hypothetical protein
MTGSDSITGSNFTAATATKETRGRTPTRPGETQVSNPSITVTNSTMTKLEPEAVDDSEALTAVEEQQLRQQAQRRRELALSKSNTSK